MANSQVQRNRSHETKVADRIATTVANALKSEASFEEGSVALSASIAGAAAAAIIGLPVAARRQLGKHQAELAKRIRGLVENFSDIPVAAKISLSMPSIVESTAGEGLGTIVSTEAGQKLLSDLAAARRVEDWAGPVAGATELQRDFGVARSTLNRWQHAGEVIAILKGTRKHAYPIEQFVDGRPAAGIGAVASLASSQRVAWLWLRQANPVLGNRRPIDLLKEDRDGEVIEAARTYFSAQ